MAEVLQELEIKKIKPSPLNCERLEVGEKFESLKLSIEKEGLIQPIAVRPVAGGEFFEIICGERRFRACRCLGWDTIPAIVRDIDERKAHTERLIENLQREDVPPLEQSEGVEYLLKQHNGNAKEVATRLGVSESWVYCRSRLSNLSAAWRNELSRDDTDYEDVKRHVTFQEELAKLPVGTQDLMLEEKTLLYCYNLNRLREVIGSQLRRIDSAPWPAKLFKNNCKKCEHRSDAQGNKPLFKEYIEEEGAVCLNPECWEWCIFEWLKSEAEKLKSKDPESVLLCYNYPAKEDFEKWEGVGSLVWRLAHNIIFDKDCADEGCARETKALFLDGDKMGQVVPVWIDEEWNDDDSFPELEKPEQTEEEKAAQLAKEVDEARRGAMLACLRETLWSVEGEHANFEPPSDRQLFWLVANGFLHRDVSEMPEFENESFYELDLDECRIVIWESLCLDLSEDLDIYGFNGQTYFSTEKNIHKFIKQLSATEDVRLSLADACEKAACEAEEKARGE